MKKLLLALSFATASLLLPLSANAAPHNDVTIHINCNMDKHGKCVKHNEPMKVTNNHHKPAPLPPKHNVHDFRNGKHDNHFNHYYSYNEHHNGHKYRPYGDNYHHNNHNRFEEPKPHHGR